MRAAIPPFVIAAVLGGVSTLGSYGIALWAMPLIACGAVIMRLA